MYIEHSDSSKTLLLSLLFKLVFIAGQEIVPDPRMRATSSNNLFIIAVYT